MSSIRQDLRPLLVVFIAQCFCAFSSNAQDAMLGRLLVAQCAQCHGTDTNPYPGFENLAGKTFDDIYDDLLGRLFENEDLDLMTHQTQGYTVAQLEQIAIYLSSLPRR